jgi:hypothetical protein
MLTVFLRLWRLDLVEFRDDQAVSLRLAEDMVRLGRVSVAGITNSLGIPQAATFDYALAPIVVLSRDPGVDTGAIGLANAAGVVGSMLLGWRRFSPLTGLVAGLVYATNPWAVFFSRKVWNQDVVAPIAVLWFFCLDHAIVDEQVEWGVAAFLVFALGVGFHPSFVLLAPILVALGVVMVRRGHLKHVAIGLALAALTAVPYLIYAFQTQGSSLRILASSFARPPRIDGEGPRDIIGLIGGWGNWYVEGLHIEYLLPGRVASTPGRIETVLLAIGIAAALLLAFSRQVDHRLRLRAAGLLLWLLLPMLFTIRHTIPLFDYYFLFVLPAGALLIGLGIYKLGDLFGSRRPGWILVGSALVSIIGVASIQSVMVLRQLEYLATAYVPEYGPPLEAAEQLTRELIDQVEHSGGRLLSVELDDVNDASIGYLARPYVSEVQVVDRRRGPWDVDFTLPDQSGSPPYRLTAAPLLTPPEPLDVSYADGVKVLSASTTRAVTPGESIGLALTWSVDHPSAAPVTSRLLWEISVYDPSAHETRREAGLPHDWAYLAPGEVVVSWFPVPTANEAAEGLYQVHVRRLDPVTGSPVPASRPDAEWISGRVEVRRN